ncbi:MAG TPA: ethanolamine utilization protein EutN [Bacteroidales bacterium]|nr:MAG: ethanolamine utilization protein EutN [Bacteroidetes bacterium GWF2_35_48]HBX51403.1 ethanolamine utilization protein EutN [Bacteroidales bacterium]
MILGKVVGTVVSSTQNTSLPGAKFLLIDKCNQQGKCKGDYLVAFDMVGAGRDEVVMISESSSARETFETMNKPVDAIIVGIIDVITEQDIEVYRK